MTLTIDRQQLADIQAQPDTRGITLDRVGITGLDYPILVRQQAGGCQQVTARFDLTVGLHSRQRGAHLSSLVEALHEYREQLLGLDDVVRFTQEIRQRQNQRSVPLEKSDVRIQFKYFVEKAAPVTGMSALLAYDCGYRVQIDHSSAKTTIVKAPVSTLCPCSLEISDIGAHNQRALVRVQLRQDLDDPRTVWFEDLIRIADSAASAPVYSLLKRADEKVVTEAMFGAPRFAEDVVRDIALQLHHQIDGVRYTVRCESFESIHAHNAIAEVSGVC